MDKLPRIGDRIYYTGDRANIEGWCTVTERHDATKYFGPSVTLTNDDGRKHPRLWASVFAPHSGRRFIPKAEFMAERASAMRSIEEAAARYRAMQVGA